MRIIRNDTVFEWDENKERINKQKHKLSFTTALQVFNDDNRIEKYDSVHSFDEDRYIAIGTVNDITFVVTVSYTPRDEAIRIISARKATKQERGLYYDN